MENEEDVMNFMAMADVGDRDIAVQFLTNAGWDLTRAADAYMNNADLGGGAGPSSDPSY